MSEEEFKFNIESIKFPCGLEIVSQTRLFKNMEKIKCPLHGKKCETISTRKVQEIK